MEFPTNRRDQIVMGLSICALILFMANIATFVKQRFLEDNPRHAVMIAELEAAAHGDHAEHAWEAHALGQGNTAWVISGDDCRKKRHRHVREIRRERERRYREQAARYAWRIEGEELRRSELEEDEAELERMLEDARRAARELELKLGIEAPRLKAESLQGVDVEVVESQDETGRHRYRVVVRPDDN